MTGTRFAARNRTPSRAESLKLINVTKDAERDGCWMTVKEVSGKLHSVTTVQTVFTGLVPRLAPRKGFSENSLAALPRESASERTILRSSGTFDPLHEFDQWSNLAGTVNGRNRCLLEPLGQV